jgi:flagellin
MRIQNNVAAINAHRYYGINQTNATKSIAKLSSGYRINSAADDAAGLAISEKMRAQIRGLTMASKNAQDGISLIQTAEGGLQEIDNMLQRIRELVVYASNDTQDYDGSGSAALGDRQKIQDEINQLTAEIDSMSERVEFNKKKLLNGSLSAGYADAAKDGAVLVAKAALTQKVTDLITNITTTAGTIGTLINNVSTAVANVSNALGTDAVSVEARNQVQGIVGRINSALLDVVSRMDDVSAGSVKEGTADVQEATRAVIALVSELASIGRSGGLLMQIHGELDNLASGGGVWTGTVSALRSSVDSLASTVAHILSTTIAPNVSAITNAASAYDAVYDAAVVRLAKANGTDGYTSGGTLYFQVGANANQGMTLNIGSIKTNILGIGDGNQSKDNTVQDNILFNVVAATGADITAKLDTLDKALSYVTTERSKLGAAQNRLEYTTNSLDISAENIQAAESRIRDVDMAKEMTNFAKLNILFQASTAMLAQANAFPQGVLQLLG